MKIGIDESKTGDTRGWPRGLAAFSLVATGLAFAPCARADGPATTAPASVDATATPVAAPPSRDESVEARGPNFVMVGAGLVSFGFSYAIASIVGATSSDSVDKRLFVPVAGPWIDLAARSACVAAPGGSCHSEGVNRAGLVFDGVFQGLGALAIVGGLVFHWPQAAKVASVRGTEIQLAPVQYARGGGLAAIGSF
jgi:hypothetical protein